MPTYELKCQDCDKRFDLFFMRLLRDEDKVCPQCGSRHVKTGVGGGFLGKGTGAAASSASCGDRGFT